MTGEKVIPSDLDKCHMLGKNSSTIIMEFRTREKRDAMLRSRKNLKDKKTELAALNLGKSFIIESLTREYGLIDFVCRHLKKNNQIAETWFFNGRLWVKVDDFGKKRQVSHIEDLYELFGKEEIDNLIRNTRRY